MRLARLVLAAATIASGCGVIGATNPDVFLTVGTAPGELAAFDPADLETTAEARVRLTFTNESTIDHNLVFVGPIVARTSDIVAPGASESFDFSAPAPGAYRFVCTVHETMTGTLTVR